MKTYFLLLFIFFYTFSSAQKDCEYATNVTDSLGTYKMTKEVLMHQKVFGGSEKNMFFSLVSSDEMPSLKVNYIQKSNDFIPAICFDENAKIFLQLENGKIITLFSINPTDCGTPLLIDNKNCRILTGYFIFMKETIDELKNAPISLLRIKFASETVDYVVREELISEIDQSVSKPSRYFIDFLKCVE